MAAKGKLFLVQWNEVAAQSIAAALRAQGWRVEIETEDGHRAHRMIRRYVPDIVIVDLSHRPSHGRETARSLQAVAATRAMPVVFVGGEEKAREVTRALLPDAVFTTPAQLEQVLVRLSRKVPSTEE